MNVGRLQTTLLAPRAIALGAVLVTLVALALCWGFVVDDALILAAFARVVRLEQRHAFFPGGPLVDGATPILMPWLFAPFASTTLRAFEAQRLVGALALTGSFALLAHRLALLAKGRAFVGVAVAATAFPLAAHASSGLETGLATASVAVALAASLEERTRACAAAALGVASTLRPELAVAGVAASLVIASRAQRVRLVALAALPSVVVALVRIGVFGSPLPLAVLAKPSDLRHGLLYVAVGLIVTNLWVVAICSASATRLESVDARVASRGAAVLVGVHALVVAAVGGDWMPYARLLVPVVPATSVLVALVPRASLRVVALVGAALAQAAFGWPHRAAAVTVAPNRTSVIEALGPRLAGAHRVAGLDVGYLAAAFDGPIVDLAGLTTPAVARLRGGHTSKTLPEGFLDREAVDTLVLWAPAGSTVTLGRDAVFGRVVETRLARSPAVRAAFMEAARVPWDERGSSIVVYARRPSDE